MWAEHAQRMGDRGGFRRPVVGLRRLSGLLAMVATLAVSAALADAASGSAVVAWGDNVSSEIGIGTGTLSSPVTQVTGLQSGITAISARGLHTLALRADGTVVAWGSNYFGQLGDGTTTDRATPVLVAGLSRVIAVAAGETFSLALRSDGSVVAWGANDSGQLGDGTATDHHTPTPVSGLSSGVTAIAAGAAHALALRSDGSVLAWGSDHWGQLGDGSNADRSTPVAIISPSSGVTAIAAGAAHSLAIERGGDLVAWGENSAGQLGDGTTTNRSTPVQVTGLTSGVRAVSAGSRHTLALLSDGSVEAWGSNLFGQLGDGSTAFTRKAPQPVSGLTSNVTAISAGGAHSLALRADGSVLAWGKNLYGELGDGTTTNHNVPVAVSALTSGVTAIAAGASHSVALQGAAGPAPAGGPPPPVFPPQPSAPVPVAVSGLAPGPNVPATGTDPIEWAHPVLATDPAQPKHMAIAYSDQTNCWLSLSGDGGATWTHQILIGSSGVLHPQSVSAPGTNFKFCFNPSVAYGPGGSLFYLENSVGAGFSAGNIFLSASSDGGTTFQAPQQIDLNPPPGSSSFAFQGVGVAVDMTTGSTRGTVYAEWDTNDPFGGGGTGGGARKRVLMAGCDPAAVSAYLSGGALTCRPAALVGSDTALGAVFHSLAVGQDGRVYAAWLEGGEADVANLDSVGPYELLVSSSSDQARTFGAPVIADSLALTCPYFNDTCHTFPTFPEAFVSVAAGPPGQVYATVEASRFGHARFVVSGSSDGGRTWSTRQGITLAGGSADDQHAPQVAVAPSGRVDVGWYEVVPDGNGIPGATGSATQNVYVASSFDHGQTYTAPRKLNTAPSLYINADQSAGTYGDIVSFGLASAATTTSAAWVDTRNATPDAPSKNDIFTSTVTAPTAPAAGGAPGPRISRLRLTNDPFVVARARTPISGSAARRVTGRHRRGTALEYTLSEAATVRIAISRRLPGRRRGGRCVATSPRLRRGAGCTRSVARGSLTRTSHAGPNTVAFSGRIGSKALAPGAYQATLTAVDGAGRRSSPRTVRFTIVAR